MGDEGGDGGRAGLKPARTVAGRRWEVGLIVVFALLVSVGLWRHELWRDEVQAWLLARDSDSLGALFYNSRFEGHPLLWHVCLYGLTRLSHNPLLMQGFNGLVAIASAVLAIKTAPFSLLQRGLLVFGYFFLYEYSVIARSYGLGVLLVFLFCWLYGRRETQFWAMTGVLALLANVSIFGLILSVALAIPLLVRLATPADLSGRWPGAMTVFPTESASISRLGVLLAAWIFSAYQVARYLGGPKGSGVAEVPSSRYEDINKLLQIGLRSFLPFPNFRVHSWNGHLLEDLSLLPDVGLFFLLFSGLLLLGVMVLSGLLLRRSPVFLGAYVFGSLAMCALFALVYLGSTRHYGHLFLLFVACLWLSRSSRSGLSARGIDRRRFYNRLITGMLCLQVFSGLYAYAADVRLPFSASSEAAAIIRASGWEDLPLLGLNQRLVSPLSGYLDRPIYYPEAGQFGSFWDISYPEMTDTVQVARSLNQFAASHDAFIAVLTQPFDRQTISPTVKISSPRCIAPAIVESEEYCLYKVEQH